MEGTWAVVTGASWGIGNGFAVELARRKLNVVLMARSKDRLEEVSKDLESRFGVQTKVVVVDFSNRDSSMYEAIQQLLEPLHVTVLVNNVGVATDFYKYFTDHTVQEIDSINHVNITPLAHMTRIMLPGMKKRNFGKIINVSSASGLQQHHQALPLFPVYAATKAYDLKFSQTIRAECWGTDVEVLCITPFFVTSKMSRIRKANLFVCSEFTLANATLNKLGYNLGRLQPYWFHSVQECALGIMDSSVFGRFLIRMMSERSRNKNQELIAQKLQKDQQFKKTK